MALIFMINQHSLSLKGPEKKSYIWFVPRMESFDELLLSWNAERPLRGHYVILSSVSIRNQWSPWLLYAVWGAQYQYSFHDTTSYAPVHSFQDQIEVLDEQEATGFRIRIEACDGATLDHFYTIYACASLLKSPKPIRPPPLESSPRLFVPGLSQIQLHHPRATSFCSPTSTTAVIHYACADEQLSPLKFAQNVYDAGFDIYGNWSFNVAQAFVELGPKWQCFCARAAGFETVWHYLKKGLPVVVSVKGILTGSLVPYIHGHLIVIKGYDALTHQIICMDPAFPCDEQTTIAYDWNEFMRAWQNRNYLAYFFSSKTR
jgi:hypothetical protein